MKIVSDIVLLLESIPQITFEFEKEDVLIIKSIKNNYAIEIAFWEREHTVFFENWHWHFRNNDEENQDMIETILDIIQNRSRIKEKYVNGKSKGSTLEFREEKGEYESTLKTGMITFNLFGRKKITNYEYTTIEF